MFKVFLFALGLFVGYQYGFKDAQTHEQPIHERMFSDLFGSHQRTLPPQP